MKLVSIRVQNYKCIDDSEEFSIRDLTCLAGKNESGKTALLQALRRLNPVEDSERKFNSLMEYPRRRLHEADGADPSARAVLTTNWELSEDDLAAVARLVGPSAITNPIVTISRGYENQTTWRINLDTTQTIPFLTSQIANLTEKAKQRILACSSLADLRSYLTSRQKPTHGEARLLEYIEQHFPNDDPRRVVRALLQSRLPRFLYFPTYGTLPGRVPVEHISEKVEYEADLAEGEEYFLALLNLAGTDVKELQEAGYFEELKARLEGVSNRLSDEIFRYWTQNRDLAVEFSYDEARPQDPPPYDQGHVFSLRVRNQRHRVTVGFDERSAGFVWFFSFLVWFSQTEQSYGDKLIILLDEPGLNLHGKAQGDLLRYIKEKLLPNYQVLYTTHSPFMIDADNILSVRTVEDVAVNGVSVGTKVGDRVLSADADTLFPLRAALGYDITQSLFVGEHSLLVEGPSDMLFLRWFSRQLIARGRVGLDSRWTVTPVGGIDKVASFNALFAGNQLHVAVFTDFHTGDKRKVRALEESGLLEAGHLFTASKITGQEEADIEDMLGRDLYTHLVNKCYGFEGKKQLPSTQPDDPPRPVLEEVKQHFRSVAIDGPEFDHLSPAVYLVEHESFFSDVEAIEPALDLFQKLFDGVNALLPPQG